ncbi:MAG: AI-2E family transporter [Acidobacteria bacterium]|nr:AI-2E family transporter [Acidobacteriota bacterium]
MATLLPNLPPTIGTNRPVARIISLGVLIALLHYGQLFFVTMSTAIVLALILEPFVALFMRFRVPRGLASFLVCSIALGAMYFVTLGIYTQALGLWDDMPTYTNRALEIGESINARLEGFEKTVNGLIPKRMKERAVLPDVANQKSVPRKRKAGDPAPAPTVQEVRIQQDRPGVLQWVYERLSQIYDIVFMASFVPFLVYFMLSWRDHTRRAFLHLFHGDDRAEVSRSLRGVADLTRAYIAGNFVLGIMLSVITTILFIMLRLPYSLLVGPLSGFLSLIPYVGLPLALIPPMLAALPVFSTLSQYLVVATAVAFLHLLALNLFYPKVVGGRVHLNPLAVTISLMFWGLIWGGAGLVLAIPIMAGIKAVCDNVSGLEAYGKILGD